MSVNMLSRIARNALASNVSAPLRSSLLSKPSREYPANASRLAARNIRTSEHRRNDGVKEDKKSKALTLHTFEQIEFKEKESYLEVLRQYKNNNVNRRGHVEFVRVALKYMEDYGVHRDLQVYKSLLDVLPKGKLVPTNYFQTLFMHYPEQQYIVIDLLCKMEKYCVMPDFEFQEMLLNVFGKHGAPLKKFWRMMYWMPKFANLNPWPCPRPAPADPRALARLAMYKITSVDVRTQITEYETKDVEDSIDDTWIVSAMSSLQKELLQAHSPDSPIYVEGPYSVWVADKCIDYFVLRGNSEIMDLYEDPDDVSNISIPFWDRQKLALIYTMHEQQDGIYFAMCATGTSTKDSLLSWIRCLQKQNPVLNVIPVIFKMASSTKEQVYIENSKNESEVARRHD